MKITTYQTKYTDERTICLVKETSKDYPELLPATSTENVAKIIEAVFDASNLPEERLYLIALDGARNVAGIFEVAHGILNASLVHPREIFSRAILAGAASIIISHNHPSGNLQVTKADREVTKRIGEAGELMGIGLDDHIIVAGGTFVSAK